MCIESHCRGIPCPLGQLNEIAAHACSIVQVVMIAKVLAYVFAVPTGTRLGHPHFGSASLVVRCAYRHQVRSSTLSQRMDGVHPDIELQFREDPARSLWRIRYSACPSNDLSFLFPSRFSVFVAIVCCVKHRLFAIGGGLPLLR